MNISRHVIHFAILVMSSAVLISSQADAQTNVRGDGAALILSVESEKPEYILGEPVYILTRLHNRGSEPVRVFKALHPEEGFVLIQIEGPNGDQRAFAPLAITDSDLGPENLEPEEEFHDVFPIFFGANGWSFNQIGTYTITAVYRGIPRSGGMIESPSIDISIISDRYGADELLLAAGDGRNQAGKFLLWQAGDNLTEGIERLRKLIGEFPDSPLADYANFALGKSFSQDFQNYAAKKVRLPDYQRAMEYLEAVRGNVLPKYLRIQKGIAEARTLHGMGRTESAQKVLDSTRQLVIEHPDYNMLMAPLGRLEKAE